jgi:hypothetical protein
MISEIIPEGRIMEYDGFHKNGVKFAPGNVLSGLNQGLLVLQMQTILTSRSGNIVAFVIMVAVNALANILPFGGQTTGAVSDKYYSLFTPAGFTFGIWSVIYLLLAVFVVYQVLPAQRDNESLSRISPWFKLGCAANALWMFAWHQEWIMVSLLLMAVLLCSLVITYRHIDGEAWQVRLPFSMYVGWITVAIIANSSAMQTALHWNDLGFDAVTWTLLKLAVAGAIAAVMVLHRSDIVFGLVVGWACYGISAGQSATPAVAGAATLLVLVVVLLAAYRLFHLFSRG